MTATAEFPKGVDLYEDGGATSVAASLEKAKTLKDIADVCRRSPGMRRQFQRLFESSKPDDVELSQLLGLGSIFTRRKLTEMSSAELTESFRGQPASAQPRHHNDPPLIKTYRGKSIMDLSPAELTEAFAGTEARY
jgi:hypothetical protein